MSIQSISADYSRPGKLRSLAFDTVAFRSRGVTVWERVITFLNSPRGDLVEDFIFVVRGMGMRAGQIVPGEFGSTVLGMKERLSWYESEVAEFMHNFHAVLEKPSSGTRRRNIPDIKIMGLSIGGVRV